MAMTDAPPADSVDDEALARVAARYAVAITPAMEALIDPSDPHDPIALQFRPDARELAERPDEHPDPIGDTTHSPCEGIVHRYPDRCLLKIVHVCAVYCRYCFRREMVGPAGDGMLGAAALDAALGYIARHPEIWEVILTGGDPFVLSPRRLRELTARIAAIPHVKVLRWHTRVPVVDPARVTADLAAAIRTADATTWVVLHANHPRELTPAARAALARLADAGIPLLAQSVLLKGVNDDADTLEALLRALVQARVKPYYLHHLDRAPGTSHFRVPIARGRELVEALRARVSGVCQPTYVLDLPGGHGKTPIAESGLREGDAGYEVRDGKGDWHPYVDIG
jgi:lysine 2,3-aminomutase